MELALLAVVIGLQITNAVQTRRILTMTETIHQEFKAFRTAVDKETTRIADLLAKAIAKANDDGLTDEEQADINATLAHLRAIGAEEVLPVVPPTPALDAIPAEETPQENTGSAV